MLVLCLQACVQTARDIADKVTIPERSISNSMGGTPADRDMFAAELRQLPGGIASAIADLVAKGVAYHNSGEPQSGPVNGTGAHVT